MATTKKSSWSIVPNPLLVDGAATVKYTLELNDEIRAIAKRAGGVSLGTYDQTLAGMLDSWRTVADTWRLDWVSLFAGAQADAVASLSTAYTAALREALD